MRLECGWRHAQKRWAENLEDFEKKIQLSSDYDVEKLKSDHDVEKLKSDHGVEGWHWAMEADSWVFYRCGGGD